GAIFDAPPVLSGARELMVDRLSYLVNRTHSRLPTVRPQFAPRFGAGLAMPSALSGTRPIESAVRPSRGGPLQPPNQRLDPLRHQQPDQGDGLLPPRLFPEDEDAVEAPMPIGRSLQADAEVGPVLPGPSQADGANKPDFTPIMPALQLFSIETASPIRPAVGPNSERQARPDPVRTSAPQNQPPISPVAPRSNVGPVAPSAPTSAPTPVTAPALASPKPTAAKPDDPASPRPASATAASPQAIPPPLAAPAQGPPGRLRPELLSTDVSDASSLAPLPRDRQPPRPGSTARDLIALSPATPTPAARNLIAPQCPVPHPTANAPLLPLDRAADAIASPPFTSQSPPPPHISPLIQSPPSSNGPEATPLSSLATPAPAPPQPTIHISIGRIEIKAKSAPSAPSKSRRPSSAGPKVSLSSYLQNRNRQREGTP
ncbi:MAG: hypothetical protein WBA10_18425, partial [Elainellaceae cyanobacterium]